MAEWRWIRIFAEHFERCGLAPGEVVAVLSESSSRPELVETARLAAQSLDGQIFDLIVPTPVNDQPVAIRSTGASAPCRATRACWPRWARPASCSTARSRGSSTPPSSAPSSAVAPAS